MEFIPYSKQHIDEEDIRSVTEVLRGPYLTTGPEISKFEEALSSYLDSRRAIVCSNGTAALHLALKSLNIKSGDAVLTTSLTFSASANAILYNGATPVLCDIRESDLLIDPARLEGAIKLARRKGLNPRCIIPVHYAGKPCEMAEITKIAQLNDMYIVEDACHAAGAEILDKGEMRKIGSSSYADLTCFSFHPVKHIATGEGGAIVTNNIALADELEKLRSHGINRNSKDFQDRSLAYDRDGNLNPWYYEIVNLGYNYRMPDILAILGRSQLKKLMVSLNRRRQIAAIYTQELASVKNMHLLSSGESTILHAYHLFVVKINFKKLNRTRAELMNELMKRSIGTQVHYIPVHYLPYYKNNPQLWITDGLTNTEQVYEEILSIPMYPSMSDNDVLYVIKNLKELLQ